MRSFSYGGIHLSSYGIYLAQAKTDTHIWESDYKAIDDSVDSQDGGVWHGSSVGPKAFNLDCFFEEISEYQLTSFMHLFNQSQEGSLVFDERPWLSYKARAVKAPEIEKYIIGGGRYSGRVKVYLKAYYPFASSTANTLDDTAIYGALQSVARDTTCLISAARMPSQPVPSAGSPQVTEFLYPVHNAGNAKADTIIRIAGDVSEGVVISNPLTNQICKVIGLTKALTTNVDKWLEINSRTGECFITDGMNRSPGWQYHDKGYIQLSGHSPILRDIPISYSGNTVTTSYDVFSQNDTGKSVFIDDKWATIVMVNNARSVVVNPPASSSGTGSTDIIRLNSIHINPLSLMSLSKFEVIYKHTFT